MMLGYPYAKEWNWTFNLSYLYQTTLGKFSLFNTIMNYSHPAEDLLSRLTMFNLVQFSHSVMSHSLQPHGLQHAGLPCPSPPSGACSNSFPLSWWCHPTISSSVVPSPPAFNLSQHQSLFQWVSSMRQGPKYWSFSFSISPSNEYSGLISFRIDWLDLLAVQGTLKSLFQHHSSKASILWRSAFFIVQLSHPYMTTGKNKALTRWTFVSKAMSLLFNMLSRLVIAFLPRSKQHFFVQLSVQHLHTF